MTVNITIPHRQHQLKQGNAILIIRDNAISITTKDQPPKLQCTILIRHIKHYGDFDHGFVFETGDKCPRGENTFLISCKNNKQLYTLLNSLANRTTTIRDIVLRCDFSEIATPQGPPPKSPLFPNSPSFNFGNLPSQLQLRGNKQDIGRPKPRCTSYTPDSHASSRQLLHLGRSESCLPYYNMEASDNYKNLGPDGRSIVPEVEYEIIPDDVFMQGRNIKPR